MRQYTIVQAYPWTPFDVIFFGICIYLILTTIVLLKVLLILVLVRRLLMRLNDGGVVVVDDDGLTLKSKLYHAKIQYKYIRSCAYLEHKAKRHNMELRFTKRMWTISQTNGIPIPLPLYYYRAMLSATEASLMASDVSGGLGGLDIS